MIRHDAWPKTPKRHVLRATFDDGAEGYDDARPVAPPEVFDDLVALAGLEPGARVLEIGCGTGQATLPLAERGFSILAVELGANLAELARRKLAAYPEVEIVTSSFEEWDPGRRALRRRRLVQRVPLDRPRHPVCEDGVRAEAGRLARRVRLGLRRPRRSGSACGSMLFEHEAATAGFEPRHIDSRARPVGRVHEGRALQHRHPTGRTSGISRTAPTTTSRWSGPCRRIGHSRTTCARSCSSASGAGSRKAAARSAPTRLDRALRRTTCVRGGFTTAAVTCSMRRVFSISRTA